MTAVNDGDCAVSIAAQLGFQDYRSLWDDAQNDGLKRTRPNPNQLVVGDDVKATLDKKKTVTKGVDGTHTFALTGKKLPTLRLILLDREGKALAGTSWELTAPKAATGKTKSDGVIRIADLDPASTSGTLKVVWRKSTPPKKKAEEKDEPVKKPTYPRPIKASEFTDKLPDPPDEADNTIEWTLKIGSLSTFDTESGVTARLYNLGFRCDPAAPDAAVTTASVKAYQRTLLKAKTPSGASADVQTDVRDRHDNA